MSLLLTLSHRALALPRPAGGARLDIDGAAVRQQDAEVVSIIKGKPGAALVTLADIEARLLVGDHEGGYGRASHAAAWDPALQVWKKDVLFYLFYW